MDRDNIRSPSPTIPEACHRSSNEIQDDELEATELLQIIANSRGHRPSLQEEHWYDPVRRYWEHHIRVSVPHASCRDHLANERTFLGYLRTSVAMSVIGVIVAQLFTLQHAPNPSPTFGFYMLGKPVAAIMQASALFVVLIGANRYWRQQSAMQRDKVIVGGWEINVVGAYSLLLLTSMLAVIVGVDIYKSTR